jgi:hypothetical protein
MALLLKAAAKEHFDVRIYGELRKRMVFQAATVVCSRRGMEASAS